MEKINSRLNQPITSQKPAKIEKAKEISPAEPISPEIIPQTENITKVPEVKTAQKALKTKDDMHNDLLTALNYRPNQQKKEKSARFFSSLISRVMAKPKSDPELLTFIKTALKIEKTSIENIDRTEIGKEIEKLSEILTEKERTILQRNINEFLLELWIKQNNDFIAHFLKAVLENTTIRSQMLPILYYFLKSFCKERLNLREQQRQLRALTELLQIFNKTALITPSELLEKILLDVCNDFYASIEGQLYPHINKFLLLFILSRSGLNLSGNTKIKLSERNKQIIANTSLLKEPGVLPAIHEKIDFVLFEDFTRLNPAAAKFALSRPNFFSHRIFQELNRIEEIYRIVQQKKEEIPITSGFGHLKVKAEKIVEKIKNNKPISSLIYQELLNNLCSLSAKKKDDGRFFYSDPQIEHLVKTCCSEKFRRLDNPGKKMIYSFLMNINESSPLFAVYESLFISVPGSENLVALEASLELLLGYEHLVKIMINGKDPFFQLIIFSFGKAGILSELPLNNPKDLLHIQKLKLFQQYFVPVTLKLTYEDFQKIISLKPEEIEIFLGLLAEDFAYLKLANSSGSFAKLLNENKQLLSGDNIFVRLAFSTNDLMLIRLNLINNLENEKKLINYDKINQSFRDLIVNTSKVLKNQKFNELKKELKELLLSTDFSRLEPLNSQLLTDFLAREASTEVLKNGILSDTLKLFSNLQITFLLEKTVKTGQFSEFFSNLNLLLILQLISGGLNTGNIEEFSQFYDYLSANFGLLVNALDQVMLCENNSKAYQLIDFIEMFSYPRLNSQDKQILKYLFSKYEFGEIFKEIEEKSESLAENNGDLSELIATSTEKLIDAQKYVDEQILPGLREQKKPTLIFRWLYLKNRLNYYLGKIFYLQLISEERIEEVSELFSEVAEKTEEIDQDLALVIEFLREENLGEKFALEEQIRSHYFSGRQNFLDSEKLIKMINNSRTSYFTGEEYSKAKDLYDDKIRQLKKLRSKLADNQQKIIIAKESLLFQNNDELIKLTLGDPENKEKIADFRKKIQNLISEIEAEETGLTEEVQSDLKANRDYLLKLKKVIIKNETKLLTLEKEKSNKLTVDFLPFQLLENYQKFSKTAEENESVSGILFYATILREKINQIVERYSSQPEKLPTCLEQLNSVFRENIFFQLPTLEKNYFQSFINGHLDQRGSSFTFAIPLPGRPLRKLNENLTVFGFPLISLKRLTKDKLKMTLQLGETFFNTGFLLDRQPQFNFLGEEVLPTSANGFIFECFFANPLILTNFIDKLIKTTDYRSLFSEISESKSYFTDEEQNILISEPGLIAKLKYDSENDSFSGKIFFPTEPDFMGNYIYLSFSGKKIQLLGLNLINPGKFISTKLTGKLIEEQFRKLLFNFANNLPEAEKLSPVKDIYPVLQATSKKVIELFGERKYSEHFNNCLQEQFTPNSFSVLDFQIKVPLTSTSGYQLIFRE